MSGSVSRTSTIVSRDQNEEVHHEAYPEPNEKGGVDPFLVKFDENDPQNPKTWSLWRKWYITVAGGLLLLNATFASSAPSGVIVQLIEEFGMGREVATLAISLFVAGYCVGPLVWGPMSEQYGRRPVFLVAFLFYTGFQVGCALSPNTGAILVFRLLGGMFAAAPLTNSGAILSDIWDAKQRGKAMAFFTIAPFAGPAIGPTVGGYITVAGVSWRWVFWILTIYAGACWVQILLTIPETYEPMLLVKKARQRRKETGDERYYAQFEKQKTTIAKKIERILARPFRVLFREPMLIAITLYMSFIYGCIYLLFEAYPIVFTQDHGLNYGASGLVFLPIPIGGTLAIVCYLLYYNPRYERAVDKYAPAPVPPEARLEMAMLAGPIFAASFFWFGWTSYPSINYWAPLMSGLPLGFSIELIFLSLFNYIIDAYLFVAASALAANTVVRSLFGAGFPLFATQMYETLNPRWASTLLGLISVLLMPIPFVLIKFGPKIRARSHYSPTAKPPEKINVSPA
ncbi:MFS general substrate transporter [Neolentinus lepideus HHB14362 ss-1]|uniref:MFS general substrate transporter n=1 Tax=Neolentinus lepideus HHB14362 ss-1 TaxID=1314782 RepID=A0A165W4W6_9AGAM|nr:MFS general substrate transporter [Neolentinus lepideus HHB14362 ss-1]